MGLAGRENKYGRNVERKEKKQDRLRRGGGQPSSYPASYRVRVKVRYTEVRKGKKSRDKRVVRTI